MSFKKKILVILQLSFAFTYLFWLLFQPSIKNSVVKKTERTLYERVFEKKSLFEALTPQDQTLLIESYKALPEKNFSFSREIFHTFFNKTPAFALAWLFFSLVLSFLLLFEIEGAKQTVWILPLVVVCLTGSLVFSPPQSPYSLFPPEHYVLATYPDPNSHSNQRERLLFGWHRYLITEWAHETPSSDEEHFQEQLEKGLFAFNVERLKWTLQKKEDDFILAGFSTHPSFFRLLLYFIWNCFFAWEILKPAKKAIMTTSESTAMSKEIL